MAYVRSINAAASAASPRTTTSHHHIISSQQQDLLQRSESLDKSPRKDETPKKPLVIFGFDITHMSPLLQYFVLAGGLLFFMCLYGYYQELVVYGWFKRKLSLFSTFLHFLGCSFFAQLQYHYNRKRLRSIALAAAHPTAAAHSNPTHHSTAALAMGTAPFRLALGYYLLLVFLKTSTQGLTTMCMAHINYPAKVLFKSCNPVITMIFGIFWFKKTYPRRDYIVVALLVIGLFLFMNGDASSSPQGTGYGIVLVTLAMFGSAGVPMVQEHCMMKFNASIEELLYHQYLGSTLVSFVLAVVSGEFFSGISFLLSSGNIHTWISFAGFCTFGYFGANYSAALTMQFGSLVNGITNTGRKAVTLALSFALFPERNHLTQHHVLGASIFFCGLIVRSITKGGGSDHTTGGRSRSGTMKNKSGRDDDFLLMSVGDDAGGSAVKIRTPINRNGGDAADGNNDDDVYGDNDCEAALGGGGNSSNNNNNNNDDRSAVAAAAAVDGCDHSYYDYSGYNSTTAGYATYTTSSDTAAQLRHQHHYMDGQLVTAYPNYPEQRLSSSELGPVPASASVYATPPHGNSTTNTAAVTSGGGSRRRSNSSNSASTTPRAVTTIAAAANYSAHGGGINTATYSYVINGINNNDNSNSSTPLPAGVVTSAAVGGGGGGEGGGAAASDSGGGGVSSMLSNSILAMAERSDISDDMETSSSFTDLRALERERERERDRVSSSLQQEEEEEEQQDLRRGRGGGGGNYQHHHNQQRQQQHYVMMRGGSIASLSTATTTATADNSYLAKTTTSGTMARNRHQEESIYPSQGLLHAYHTQRQQQQQQQKAPELSSSHYSPYKGAPPSSKGNNQSDVHTDILDDYMYARDHDALTTSSSGVHSRNRPVSLPPSTYDTTNDNIDNAATATAVTSSSSSLWGSLFGPQYTGKKASSNSDDLIQGAAGGKSFNV